MARDDSRSYSPAYKRRSPPRRRAASRSASRGRGRDPPRRRRDSRSRSPPRRRGRDDGRKGGGGDINLESWGNEGTIVDMKSGFGFIRPKSGQVDGRDLYFHATGCARGTSYNELRVNDEVTYDVAVDDRRNQSTAKNVKLTNERKDSRSRSPSRRR
mmetsp:Transcript_121297/g.213877  ORF Transcript_121297/g.213877 Transcript_121297/m.213877 type:complete len:157 (+) Transcript_121297:76-546(+)